MKKIKLFIILSALFALTSCTGLTPTASAGIGVNVDLTKKMPIRPRVTGGLNLGLFRFF